jgi:molybdopterin synthase catalytic subunit
VQIVVRLFALQRQQLGTGRLEIDVPDGATVAGAWDALAARYPQLAPAAGVVRFARNGAYTATDDALEAGDELAVIPPVAGGADAVPTIELTSDPIDEAAVGRLYAALVTDDDGAAVIFLGRTRRTAGTPAPGQEGEAERHAGQDVEALEYEAYESMARDVLARIADEARQRFAVDRLGIVHRTGVVALGETSVAVVACAPHREAAFEAARYAIDELKARAPIWKSERFADGSVWLGAPARMEALG